MTQAELMFLPLLILGIVLFIIAISAYSVATIVLVMVRFYKNFFTDEAYLTFTLPVKRSTLFNSKLLTAFIFNTATGIVITVALTVFLAIAPSDINGLSMLSVMIETFDMTFRSLAVIMNGREGAWVVAYITLLVIYILVSFITQTLLLFFTVTFGSLLVKRLKVLMSILIYYGVNMAMTLAVYIVELVLSIGINLLAITPEVLQGTEILWLVLGGLIFMICALGLVGAFFYKFALNKLRGNLNLA